jgi:hypothetical protein
VLRKTAAQKSNMIAVTVSRRREDFLCNWIVQEIYSAAFEFYRLLLEPLEHDPEKCVAVFRKDHAQNKELKRDDDST